MARGDLVFASLGGVGEIGMNLSLYGVGDERRRQWLIVDCGVSFAAEEHLPGVDLILPDIRYLIAERRNIVGLVLTHPTASAGSTLAHTLVGVVYAEALLAAATLALFREPYLDPGCLANCTVNTFLVRQPPPLPSSRSAGRGWRGSRRPPGNGSSRSTCRRSDWRSR